MNGATTFIFHDRRFKKKDGTYAVKLRITYQREQKHYPINVSLTADDFDKTQLQRPRGKHKEWQALFSKVELRAMEVIKDMEKFSFPAFEKKFLQKSSSTNGVVSYFEKYISDLQKEGRSNTAYSYNNAYNSIMEFLKGKNRKKLKFSDITPDWLKDYEKWMLDNGKSLTTVGIYLRSLRTILNLAIEEGKLDREFYPFGKRKYTIPSGQNIKKALSLVQIKEIYEYQPTTKGESKSRDLWLFSYLCNGVNIKDVARLKYKNIDGNRLTFIRAKTERSTKQNLKPIVVMMIPQIHEIIDRWGQEPREPETYIFGMIDGTEDAKKESAKIRQVIKIINKNMERIRQNLGFSDKITTYTARHSFATVLKRKGASTEFISESLGHKDLRTTENYLSSFEDDVKESYQKQLLDFS